MTQGLINPQLVMFSSLHGRKVICNRRMTVSALGANRQNNSLAAPIGRKFGTSKQHCSKATRRNMARTPHLLTAVSCFVVLQH